MDKTIETYELFVRSDSSAACQFWYFLGRDKRALRLAPLLISELIEQRNLKRLDEDMVKVALDWLRTRSNWFENDGWCPVGVTKIKSVDTTEIK